MTDLAGMNRLAAVRDRIGTLHARFRSPILELIRFAMVGVIGLIVNMGMVRLYLVAFGDRPFSAGLVAWPFAVTTTWWCNRQFTFRDHVRAPMLRQWAHFVAVNLTGAAAQYATYATLVACLGLCRTYPEIAVAAGAVTGMMFNFGFARRFVFKR
jgi:putative flippase GtrA